jgi:hypothetical protein
VELCIQHFDLTAETGELRFDQTQAVDFKSHLHLQKGEVDGGPMQPLRLYSGCLQSVYQSLGKRATVRVIAAGMFGNERKQRGPSCFENDVNRPGFPGGYVG